MTMKRTTIYVDAKVYEAAKVRAARDSSSITREINKFLRLYIDGKEVPTVDRGELEAMRGNMIACISAIDELLDMEGF